MASPNNKQIREMLEALAEKEYGEFSKRLIPGEVLVLGVRLPKLRKIAKQLAKGDWQEYLQHAADDSMEETLLQGMTLGYVKADFENKEPYLTRFIPKIDNWSVCDSTCSSMKDAKQEPALVWEYLQSYLASEQAYEIRFGVVMLLNYYINDDYIAQVLEWMERIKNPHYYVKMAVAWNVSMCYVAFPKQTMSFLQQTKIDDWTYNKAIQKIRESHQVSAEEKEFLKSMKRNVE